MNKTTSVIAWVLRQPNFHFITMQMEIELNTSIKIKAERVYMPCLLSKQYAAA